MSLLNHFLVMAILVACGAFLSMSEISIAAARKIKLKIEQLLVTRIIAKPPPNR